jgi:hypothetical protein
MTIPENVIGPYLFPAHLIDDPIQKALYDCATPLTLVVKN